MAHLKQVGLVLRVLADDNNGWVNGINAPCGGITVENCTPTNWFAGWVDWRFAITNYLGNTGVVAPPFILGKRAVLGCPAIRDSDSGKNPYGANTAFTGAALLPMHSLREVNNAATIFLAGDCYTWGPHANIHFWSTMLGDTSGMFLAPRHEGLGLNFVLVDGHVEFVKDNPGLAQGVFRQSPADTWPGYPVNGDIWSE